MSKPALAQAAAQAADAVRALQDEGCDVRFLDSLLVPADEVAIYRFAAPSADEVHRAATTAGLPYERVVEYVEPQGG